MPVALSPKLARSRLVFTWLLRALAAALMASTFVAAMHDVSTTWDVWYYHLPFAARIWGIVPESVYAFHAQNEARFQGFPLLAEILQGLFWRASGHPQASNLVAFAAVPLHAIFLKRVFHVPLHLSVLALMAIPLVELHASSSYIDLPSNAAASMLVLLVYHLLTQRGEVPSRSLLLLGVLSAFAVNMRFQLIPIVLLALAAASPRVLAPLTRDLVAAGRPRERALLRLAAIIVALPILFASPLKNLILHHNPFYPVKMELLGIALPGMEDVYSSSPPYLESAPRPLRFLYSLLEVGIRPITDRRRWTIDQWMPEGSTGNRMGGYFGAYVVFHLAALGWTAARSPRKEARAAGALFAVLALVTALLPQSHELRYYLYFMLVLVSLNLILACQREGEGAKSLSPSLLATVSAGALLIVLAVTRFGYAYPSGASFSDLLQDKVQRLTLEQIHEGDKVCLAREPWTILYAATFHPPSRYAVKEAERKEDCGDYRWIE